MTRQSFCVVSNAPGLMLGVGERCVTTPKTAHDKLILVDGVSLFEGRFLKNIVYKYSL